MPKAPEADSTQSGPREARHRPWSLRSQAWLFEMSRGEYLQTRPAGWFSWVTPVSL